MMLAAYISFVGPYYLLCWGLYRHDLFFCAIAYSHAVRSAGDTCLGSERCSNTGDKRFRHTLLSRVLMQLAVVEY